jgi:hypothetical protein
MIVARYAGPANALAQVARILIADDRVTTVVVGFSYAEPIFRQHGLPLWAVDDDEETPNAADRILEDERPDLVLTGTSLKPRLDGAFWAGAKERHIPAIALVDHWTKYSERFSDDSGNRYAYLPDTIAVMDETARNAMIATGCPAERLAVTGQPAFDDFVTLETDSSLRALARRELSVVEDDALVVFASSPQARYYGADEGSPTFPGYTEEDSLRLLLETLGSLEETRKGSVQVIVKLHPLETPERLAKVIRQNKRWVRLLRHYPERKLIAASDVVTGMTSVFLLEGALSGKRAISVQPSSKDPDEFIDHHQGLICRADNATKVRRLLAVAFSETDSAHRERRQLALSRGFDGLAGRRVAELAYAKLGLICG